MRADDGDGAFADGGAKDFARMDERAGGGAGSDLDAFEQAVLPVQDEKTFAEVEKALQNAFAPANVAKFLRQLEKERLRARQFEAILAHGILGAQAPALYGSLGDSDRGQIREMYLRMVEHVAPEVRAKFLKVYAYY